MLKNSSISVKLAAGFGAVLVFLIIISVISIINLSSLNGKIDEIVNNRVVKLKLATVVDKELQAIFRNTQTSLMLNDAESREVSKKKLEAARTGYREAIEKLEQMTTEPDGKAVIEELKKGTADGRVIINKINELSGSGKISDAIALYVNTYDAKMIPRLLGSTSAIVKYQDDKLKEAQTAADSAYGTSRMIILISGIAAVIIGFFIAYILTVSIRKPLNDAVEAMGRVAAGDLTVKVDADRTDEIGRLLSSIKDMIMRLSQLIGSIKTTTASLASGAEELSASSGQISRNMNEQSSRASQIATAAEEMSQTVIDVARNAGSIADSASQAALKAKNGEDSVYQTISEVNEIATTVRDTSELMKTLGDRSNQIGEIVRVINDIADQTNLLALNAAIEAARAGEQGRGFAVVADEVRKLAERTAKATAEISTMIRTIQDEVHGAVDSMESATNRVASGVALATEAGSTLREIVTSVDGLQSMVQQIASATEEMSSVSEHVSSDVQNVASSSKDISLGSEQIAHVSSNIARLGTELQTAVSQFRV
jgi:methyl-accepting chemotaxis protein